MAGGIAAMTQMTDVMTADMAEQHSATLGRHLLVEFYNCDPNMLDNTAGIEAHMNEAARACGATIVQSVFHRFSPWGVSGVVVISESHLAIHTWPEHGYASVDLYTCGDTVDPMVACEYLRKALNARSIEFQAIRRGDMSTIRMRLQGEPDHSVASLTQPAFVQGGAA
jgi:S-adenosylmethionine decarboxylase